MAYSGARCSPGGPASSSPSLELPTSGCCSPSSPEHHPGSTRYVAPREHPVRSPGERPGTPSRDVVRRPPRRPRPSADGGTGTGARDVEPRGPVWSGPCTGTPATWSAPGGARSVPASENSNDAPVRGHAPVSLAALPGTLTPGTDRYSEGHRSPAPPPGAGTGPGDGIVLGASCRWGEACARDAHLVESLARGTSFASIASGSRYRGGVYLSPRRLYRHRSAWAAEERPWLPLGVQSANDIERGSVPD
jgi:hypothetical protein